MARIIRKECKFEHKKIQTNEQKKNSDQREKEDEENSEIKKMEKEKTGNVCWQFEEKGECWYGEKCKYEHRGRMTDKRGEEKQQDKETICWWNKRGKCRFGEKCKWRHQEVKEEEVSKIYGREERRGETCRWYLRGDCKFGHRCWRRNGEENKMGEQMEQGFIYRRIEWKMKQIEEIVKELRIQMRKK